MMRLWSEQLPDADQEAAESRQPYRAAVGVFTRSLVTCPVNPPTSRLTTLPTITRGESSMNHRTRTPSSTSTCARSVTSAGPQPESPDDDRAETSGAGSRARPPWLCLGPAWACVAEVGDEHRRALDV